MHHINTFLLCLFLTPHPVARPLQRKVFQQSASKAPFHTGGLRGPAAACRRCRLRVLFLLCAARCQSPPIHALRVPACLLACLACLLAGLPSCVNT